MISGLFFFLLPSGAGVRELIIVTALAPTIGSGQAIAIAAVSRVLIVVADLLTAAAAAGLGWWEQRRYGPIPHDQGVEDDEVLTGGQRGGVTSPRTTSGRRSSPRSAGPRSRPATAR